jgi:predicted RNA binding protein YcfA (HicA-like mRNA interferase family)
MKARDIIRLLEQDGWYLKASKGSHRQYKHPTKSGRRLKRYVPDLPGVVTAGSTKKSTKQLIRETIEFHLEGLREDNLAIPGPVASAEVVTVS